MLSVMDYYPEKECGEDDYQHNNQGVHVKKKKKQQLKRAKFSIVIKDFLPSVSQESVKSAIESLTHIGYLDDKDPMEGPFENMVRVYIYKSEYDTIVNGINDIYGFTPPTTVEKVSASDGQFFTKHKLLALNNGQSTGSRQRTPSEAATTEDATKFPYCVRIYNIPAEMDHKELKKNIIGYLECQVVVRLTMAPNGSHTGSGFLLFETQNNALGAIDLMDGLDMCGHEIHLEMVTKHKEKNLEIRDAACIGSENSDGRESWKMRSQTIVNNFHDGIDPNENVASGSKMPALRRIGNVIVVDDRFELASVTKGFQYRLVVSKIGNDMPVEHIIKFVNDNAKGLEVIMFYQQKWGRTWRCYLMEFSDIFLKEKFNNEMQGFNYEGRPISIKPDIDCDKHFSGGRDSYVPKPRPNHQNPNMGNKNFNKGNKNSITDYHENSRTDYHENSRMDYNHHENSRWDYNHHENPRKDYNHHENPRKDYNHHENPRKDYNHHENLKKDYNHHENPRKDYNHHENPRKDYNHHENSRKDYNHHENSRMDYNHHENPKMEYDHRGNHRMDDNNHKMDDNNHKVDNESPDIGNMTPSMETFGISPDILKTLDISLPLVKELLVTNLDSQVTEDDIKELFAVAGSVVKVQYDPKRSNAIVEMSCEVDAVEAISLLHAQEYFDKIIEIHMVRPSKPETVIASVPRGLKTIGQRDAPVISKPPARESARIEKFSSQMNAHYDDPFFQDRTMRDNKQFSSFNTAQERFPIRTDDLRNKLRKKQNRNNSPWDDASANDQSTMPFKHNQRDNKYSRHSDGNSERNDFTDHKINFDNKTQRQQSNQSFDTSFKQFRSGEITKFDDKTRWQRSNLQSNSSSKRSRSSDTTVDNNTYSAFDHFSQSNKMGRWSDGHRDDSNINWGDKLREARLNASRDEPQETVAADINEPRFQPQETNKNPSSFLNIAVKRLLFNFIKGYRITLNWATTNRFEVDIEKCWDEVRNFRGKIDINVRLDPTRTTPMETKSIVDVDRYVLNKRKKWTLLLHLDGEAQPTAYRPSEFTKEFITQLAGTEFDLLLRPAEDMDDMFQ